MALLMSRRWARGLAAASSAIGLVAVTVWLAVSPGAARQASAASAIEPSAAASPPTVAVVGEDAGKVAWDHPLRLRVVNGTFGFVTAVDEVGLGVGGAPVDQSNWQTTGTLIPAMKYTVTIEVYDAHNDLSTKTVTVQATDTIRRLVSTISPGDGDVVGAGMPVSVSFNTDIPVGKRQEVVSRLSVDATPPVIGAWHWINGHDVHWRPQQFWAPGTKVSVHTDISRLDLGGGLWGNGRRAVSFSIGDAHVSTADVAAHTFTITANGQVQKVMAMSAGRDAYPTKGGVHIALEKAQVVTMDSQTVGIPRDSKDGYFEKVFWDVRISNGGAYVHAAPWSVDDQGHRNVSHGCVNLSTADAQWFFNFSRRGDVVNVINSPARPVLSDPGTADWNMSWEAWTGQGLRA